MNIGEKLLTQWRRRGEVGMERKGLSVSGNNVEIFDRKFKAEGV